MAQKIVSLPQIGEVVLSKRRGAKNLRLSITADGRVRVGIPYWAPYQAGISFAISRAEWIRQHTAAAQTARLADGQRVGRSYRLKFISDPAAAGAKSRIVGNQVVVRFNEYASETSIQTKAAAACERALKKDAEKLLPIRLRQLSKEKGIDYKSVRIKRLRSRWGSCSSKKEITLNYYLIQLPWNLIDYVILHELTHTDHLHHGPDFWRRLTELSPQAKHLRKEIKNYRPILAPAAIA